MCTEVTYVQCRGVSRSSSHLSALTNHSSIGSCATNAFSVAAQNGMCYDDDSTYATVFSAEKMFEQFMRPSRPYLKNMEYKSKETKVRRRNRTETRTNKLRLSKRGEVHTNDAVDTIVNHLISTISFISTDDDDDGVRSTVSSIGMGFVNETDDEKESVPHAKQKPPRAESNCSGHAKDDEDSITRICSQITAIRRSSLERFQATSSPTYSHSQKSDTIPALPNSFRKRLGRGREQESSQIEDKVTTTSLHDHCNQQDVEQSKQRSTFIPVAKSKSSTSFNSSATAGVKTSNTAISHRRSLPTDLSKVLNIPRGLVDEDDDIILVPPQKLDRWSSASSDTMSRDCELVKESFAKASSLRRKGSTVNRCFGMSPLDEDENASKNSNQSRVATDTMLVPPRRRTVLSI